MESVALDIISNVGFPIAVSIGLFYQMTKTNDKYLELLRDFKHIIKNNTESVDALSEAVKELKNETENKGGVEK